MQSLFDNRLFLNESIFQQERVQLQQDRSSVNFGTKGIELEANYQPTGDLRIPMLTVHKRFDRLVPYRHEAAYQQIVARKGHSKWLRQRTVEDES